MKLDLNNFLDEIYSVKNIIKLKDEKIENLHNQIKNKQLCIETLECSNQTLLQELSQFNNVVIALHQSLQKTEDYEKENKRLVAENLKLEDSLRKQEMKSLSEINELKENIQKLKATHLEDIEKNLCEIDMQVSSKLQNYCMTLREKENYIMQLENQVSSLKIEKSQEVLKVKIEYEERLNKMKNKVAKRKGYQHNDNKSADIFRQKFIEKEKEAKETIFVLKKEIARLQEEVNSLTAQNLFSNKCLSNETEKQFILKKPKLNADSSDTAELAADGNASKKTEANRYFRKKLFNLDMNYFDK